MSSRKRKWIQRIIITGLAAGAIGWLVIGLKSDRIPVEVAKAHRGSLVVTADGSGKTRMRDRITVFSPATGDISRITLRPGDTVAEGQLIANILPAVSPPLDTRTRAETLARLAAARAGLAEAKRNVDRAKIASNLAQSEVERTRYLLKAKATPVRSLDLAVAEEKTRNADLELAKLEVERARLEAAAISATLVDPADKTEDGTTKENAERIPVTLPRTGIVLSVHTESAGPILVGAPLMDIGDPNTVELEVELPTQSAVRIRPAAKVTIDGMGDGKTRRGIVRLIEPAAFTKVTALGVEEQRVNVIVTLKDPPPMLSDGFAADAHVEIKKYNNTVKVPTGAVFRSDDGFAVFTVDNKGIAKQIEVTVTARNADEVAIQRLKEGKSVIVHPSDKIQNGVSVSIKKQ